LLLIDWHQILDNTVQDFAFFTHKTSLDRESTQQLLHFIMPTTTKNRFAAVYVTSQSFFVTSCIAKGLAFASLEAVVSLEAIVSPASRASDKNRESF